jgi:AraC-like DNA-binding protein
MIRPVGTRRVTGGSRWPLASVLLLSSGRVRQANATGSLARQQVVAFLRARHGDPTLSVDDVAHACLISRRTLYRLFEGSLDGVGSLLRRIRIEHAQALLRADTSRSLESIALEKTSTARSVTCSAAALAAAASLRQGKRSRWLTLRRRSCSNCRQR